MPSSALRLVVDNGRPTVVFHRHPVAYDHVFQAFHRLRPEVQDWIRAQILAAYEGERGTASCSPGAMGVASRKS